MAGPVIDALTLLGWPLILGQPAGPSGGGGVMLVPNCCVAVLPVASATLTVKVDDPTVVGDPVICPLGASVRPAGRAPPASIQVYGGVVSPCTPICPT